MPRNYRFYCLDRTGQLHNSVSFHAENDQDAIAQIEAKHPEDKCEIWEGKRLVATLGKKPLSSSIECSRRKLTKAHRVLRETAALVGTRYQAP